jgi:hypothetical protein
MQINFTYKKKKVIQALRYHFISRSEIRIMMILVNVFAITSAVLFYTKKIRPEPFFLGTCIWIFMMIGVWYILPYTIYKKTSTFKDRFGIMFEEDTVRLDNDKGYASWKWQQFNKFFESPHFFHLYFNARSFFLVPKDNMNDTFQHELRGLLNKKIGK